MNYLALGLTWIQLVMDVVVHIWVIVLDRVLVEAALLVKLKAKRMVYPVFRVGCDLVMANALNA